MKKREPLWLPGQAVIAMHEEMLRHHGGISGFRGISLLHSALASPQNKYAYTKCSIFDLAANHAHSLRRNHPFLDGNKRTAFMAAYAFLGINGWEFVDDEARVVRMVMALTNRTINESEFAAWLKRHSSKMRKAERKRQLRHHLRRSRKKR